MRLLKCWVLGVALSLGAVAVYAGPYEDGIEALRRGDISSAAKLVRKAADSGNADAQYFLGYKYAVGSGVPTDQRAAAAWYCRAAEQGHAMAQHDLGLMYDLGRGVPKDEQQAYFWLLLSSAQDLKHAAESRDLVESRLTPGQRSAAQAKARDWKPRKQ